MAEVAYTDTNISSFDQDKNTVFLENPELNELGIWSSFQKIVSPLIQLLIYETNKYANRNKNNRQFKVNLEELKI